MKKSNKLTFAALISLSLVVAGCRPNVPVKTEDNTKVLQAIPNDMVAMKEMSEGLTPQTQKAMLALGIKLPPLPEQPTKMSAQGLQKALFEATGLNALVEAQGTPEDPDSKLLRGTYTRDSLGKLTKTKNEPTDGMVINFTVEGVNFTQTTKYKEIAVLASTWGNSTYYREQLMDLEDTLTSGGETLYSATVNQDFSKCKYTSGNSTYDVILVNKADASLNVGDQITAKGNLSAQGKQGSVSAEFKMTTSKHTLAVNGKANFTATTENTCASVGTEGGLTAGDIKLNVALDSNAAEFTASAKNYSTDANGQPVGDFEAKLVYSTPNHYANLFTAKGNMKDGPDADTIAGDQVEVKVLLEKEEGIVFVTTNWQKFVDSLYKMPLPIL